MLNREITAGLIALMLWVTLLAGGIVVGTEPYRRKLTQPDSVPMTDWVTAALTVMACYTPTNVGLLSCLAALLGGAARRSKLGETQSTVPGNAGAVYLAAILRGFFVYLLVLAGLLVFSTESITDPTPKAYVRIAGLTSVAAFVIGHNPGLFDKFLNLVVEFMGRGQGAK